MPNYSGKGEFYLHPVRSELIKDDSGNIVGDKALTAQTWRDFNGKSFTNGVISTSGEMNENDLALKVVSGNGMQVLINNGSATALGGQILTQKTEQIPVDLEVSPAIDRNDLIVLRIDYEDERDAYIYAKQNYQGEDLLRTSTIYELGIASVLIKADSTAIIQEDITDLRSDSDMCGWSYDILARNTVEPIIKPIIIDHENRLDTIEPIVANHTTELANVDTRLDGHDINISTLNSTVTNHETRIITNESNIVTHESRLNTVESTIVTHTSELIEHETQININANNISNHDSRLSSLEPTVSDHSTEITNLDSRLTTAESTISSHETRLDGHDSTINNHETRIDSLENTSVKKVNNIIPDLNGNVDLNGTDIVLDNVTVNQMHIGQISYNQSAPMVKTINGVQADGTGNVFITAPPAGENAESGLSALTNPATESVSGTAQTQSGANTEFVTDIKILKTKTTDQAIIDAVKRVDGAGSGLDTDFHAEQPITAMTHTKGIYNPINGILVDFGIEHSIDESEMYTVDITGNAYLEGVPINTQLQFYHYTPAGNVIHPKQLNHGHKIGACKVMFVDGIMKLWIPVTGASQTFILSIRKYEECITKDITLTSSAEPVSMPAIPDRPEIIQPIVTNKVEFPVVDTYNTGNLLPATTTTNGLMSASDKAKLDSLSLKMVNNLMNIVISLQSEMSELKTKINN